jgi:ribosomal protein L37AE/L43A
MSLAGFKLGDRVRVSYYGCRHVGEVIALQRQKVRVRFRNVSGWMIEAWRRPEAVQRLAPPNCISCHNPMIRKSVALANRRAVVHVPGWTCPNCGFTFAGEEAPKLR